MEKHKTLTDVNEEMIKKYKEENIKFEDKIILEKKYQEEISTLRQEIKILSDKLDNN